VTGSAGRRGNGRVIHGPRKERRCAGVARIALHCPDGNVRAAHRQARTGRIMTSAALARGCGIVSKGRRGGPVRRALVAAVTLRW
jgi:Pyruvate/2-oxoacid:ferredoxin oxidoreductase delta subunit